MIYSATSEEQIIAGAAWEAEYSAIRVYPYINNKTGSVATGKVRLFLKIYRTLAKQFN